MLKMISILKLIFWPIEAHEHKKFLPMAAMIFCIAFNCAILASIKDAFVITAIGYGAIGVLNILTLPFAILIVIIYMQLCNRMSSQQVFYTITSAFILFFAIFAFILYPYPELFHPDPASIASLSEQYPRFKWFISIGGQWSFAAFYAAADLYGSIMWSLLFWQFSNQITSTTEAKRFYSMFGLVGCFFPPLLASGVLYYLLSNDLPIFTPGYRFIPIICLTIFSGVLLMFLHHFINKRVLCDPLLYKQAANGTIQEKTSKLTFSESANMIFTSKYLGLLVILIFAYGISTSLVEGVWKSNLIKLHPTTEAYAMFLANFMAYQQVPVIMLVFIGTNILRRVSWETAARLTPFIVLISGIVFFSLLIFDQSIGLYIAKFFGSGPLLLAVFIGAVQNILSRAAKYSLFDPTKEMAYIPLDNEMRSKGKAVVDVLGAKFGKFAGGIVQCVVFILCPAYTFLEATPYFAGIFFIIIGAWIYAVKSLAKEYQHKILAPRV